jgi:hypothetical protein
MRLGWNAENTRNLTISGMEGIGVAERRVLVSEVQE